MTPLAETYDDTILAGLNGTLTPEAAEAILTMSFSDSQQSRMRALMEKSRAGELTDEERSEADSFERVSSLLGILQSRARMSLKQSPS